MPHQTVHAMLPGLSTEVYELKGHDFAHRSSDHLGERYTWLLTISYDEDLKVSEVNASTENSLCVCLDRSPITLGN